MLDDDEFLAAILIDPYNDTLKLVYADWLEEQGHLDQASTIRKSLTWVYARHDDDYWFVNRDDGEPLYTMTRVRLYSHDKVDVKDYVLMILKGRERITQQKELSHGHASR